MSQDLLFEFLADHFRSLIIGRNVKGIVHNLNGPLQILSMQLELLNMDLSRCRQDVLAMKESPDPPADKCALIMEMLLKTVERIAQIQDVVGTVDTNLRVVGTRSGGDGDGTMPLILNQLVEEELEFWKSDLFFKHEVALDLTLPERAPVLVMNEGLVRDIMDAAILASVERLRNTTQPSMAIDCSVGEEGPQPSFQMRFSHNGEPFDLEALDNFEKASEKGNIPEAPAFTDITNLALYMARGWAKRLGIDLLVEDRRIILSGSVSPDQSTVL